MLTDEIVFREDGQEENEVDMSLDGFGFGTSKGGTPPIINKVPYNAGWRLLVVAIAAVSCLVVWTPGLIIVSLQSAFSPATKEVLDLVFKSGWFLLIGALVKEIPGFALVVVLPLYNRIFLHVILLVLHAFLALVYTSCLALVVEPWQFYVAVIVSGTVGVITVSAVAVLGICLNRSSFDFKRIKYNVYSYIIFGVGLLSIFCAVQFMLDDYEEYFRSVTLFGLILGLYILYIFTCLRLFSEDMDGGSVTKFVYGMNTALMNSALSGVSLAITAGMVDLKGFSMFSALTGKKYKNGKENDEKESESDGSSGVSTSDDSTEGFVELLG